jgi:hypothetical protein
MNLRFASIILAAVLLLSLDSCFPSKKKFAQKTFDNSDKWLPSTFKPQKAVLLVQLFNEDVVNYGWKKKFEKWNTEMRDFMQEKYPFKYEFASEDDIVYKGKKYADTKKYPFGLMINVGVNHYTGGAAGSGPNNANSVQVFDYYFINRETGEKHPVTKKYSSNPLMTFMPVINTILDF